MPFDSIFKNLFMTPSQKKQQNEMYYKKMFPFGDKQKNWEDRIIESVYSDRKNIIPTIKYFCYTRREMLIDKTVNDDVLNKKYKKLVKRMRLSEEDDYFVEKFTMIENQANSFSDLPSLDEVIKECTK